MPLPQRRKKNKKKKTHIEKLDCHVVDLESLNVCNKAIFNAIIYLNLIVDIAV